MYRDCDVNPTLDLAIKLADGASKLSFNVHLAECLRTAPSITVEDAEPIAVLALFPRQVGLKLQVLCICPCFLD